MRESRNTEFKSEISRTFLKTVSSFANFGTGTIYFGFDDSGHHVGLEDPKASALQIENMISDSIDPVPDFDISFGLDDTLALTVMKGPHTPYFYNGKVYRRKDSSDVPVSAEEIKDLIMQSRGIRFEELACSVQDLHFGGFQSYIKEYLGLPEVNEYLLRSLELKDRDGHYNNAGLLFSDENTLPGINVVRFGENINIIEYREIVEKQCILDIYERVTELFEQYYSYEVIEGSQRNRKYRIPDRAFREALANAVIHRKWKTNANINVFMYSDRIEITSPGGLPEGVTESEYLNRNLSVLRNPVITYIFFRLRYIEHMGTGVQRIIDSYSGSTSKPVFGISENSITITLPLYRETADLTRSETLLYDSLSSVNPMSNIDLVKVTGFSRSKVLAITKKLKKEGYIEESGRGRGTKYRKQ